MVRDFRGISGREPQQPTVDVRFLSHYLLLDVMESPLLCCELQEDGDQTVGTETPQPQIKCDEVGWSAPPSPRAAPAKDEKPATVTSLETAVFRDGESGMWYNATPVGLTSILFIRVCLL